MSNEENVSKFSIKDTKNNDEKSSFNKKKS
jgi:hypothetical protein